MRRKPLSALLAATAATAMFASSGAAAGTVMYDAVPDPLPSNVVSLGYQATSTSEFGQVINPESTGPLDSVTLTMSSWACQSGGWNTGDCVTTRNADLSLPTFDHDITINIYALGNGAAGDASGALIGSVTQTIAVPYRPSTDTITCTDGRWLDASGGCFSGYAFNATFDFTGSGVTLPATFVAGVAYNTQSYGAVPTGVNGPYNSLNVGIDLVSPATIGTEGDNYWRPSSSPGFTNSGDLGYTMMIRFETAPSAPVTADDCKKGGFEQYGFSNQGQCVASVKANENAGK